MARLSSVIKEDTKNLVDQLDKTLQPLAGSTILISGACGFLGSFLLDVLAEFNRRHSENPCHVLALDNFITGVPDRVAHLKEDRNFEFRKVDLRHVIDLDYQIDWVVHAASIASPTFYRKYPLETIDVNVNGTRTLLELTRKNPVKGFLYLGTSEVYGDPDPRFIPTSETYPGLVSCTGPRACYDESKRLAETLCISYHFLYRAPVKIVRIFNAYGPGQRLDDKRIIPDLMSAALQRKPLVLFSDGKATRSFCYVRDTVAGIFTVLLTGSPGEVFNVGNDEEISIESLAIKLAAIARTPSLEVRFEASKDKNYLVDNPNRRCPDIQKIRSILDWSPRIMIEEGLSRTLQSYREGNS